MNVIFKLAILLAMVVLFSGQTIAQGYAVSTSYLYMNDSQSSGIGLQGNFKLGKFITFMPDVGYFFKKNEKTSTKNSYHKYQTSFLVINANVGHDISLGKKTFLCPLIGVGYLQKFRDGVMHSDGWSGGGEGGYSIAPSTVAYKDNSSTIVVNLGVQLKHYFSNHIFATVGYKTMFDVYDGTYNEPFYLNAGVGFCW